MDALGVPPFQEMPISSNINSHWQKIIFQHFLDLHAGGASGGSGGGASSGKGGAFGDSRIEKTSRHFRRFSS